MANCPPTAFGPTGMPTPTPASTPPTGNSRASPYSQLRHSGPQHQETQQTTERRSPDEVAVTEGIQELRISEDSRTQSAEFDKALEEYFEDSVMEHAELIQAARVMGATTPPPVPRHELTKWSSVKNYLVLLAYAPEATDHGRQLGLPRSEGPLPTLDMIERRVQLACRFASLRHVGRWAGEDVAAATLFEK